MGLTEIKIKDGNYILDEDSLREIIKIGRVDAEYIRKYAGRPEVMEGDYCLFLITTATSIGIVCDTFEKLLDWVVENDKD